jgi:DNA-binding MurR/RpiR family transcriptional regulator
MKFFAGMTIPEIADNLGVSTATITREWRLAKAWLKRELED